MIETAFTMGVLPQQLYEMELWEFNACVNAYNKNHVSREKLAVAHSWQTAAFTGAAFGGKLKRLNHYLHDDAETVTGQSLTPEEMEAFDERLRQQQLQAEGGGGDVA